ncbi:hypothetical protein FRC04_010816 [Tulasnella sp. 424]|nr:hypothetical protein FRC04_010816 [Tulasnella sp. 424]KAG8972258.1 hypothetical protein FRC05_010201 [Tulasnella sp. 425]
MHPALRVSEILTSILLFISPHNLAVACRVCQRFWQHAAPLLWADLSGPGLQALYTAFPADAILPPEVYLIKRRPKPSFRRLARSLTYEEASRIGALATFIRKASISAELDLLAENNSPLSSVQDLVGGKIFSNLQTIKLKDLASIPFDVSAINHPAIFREHIVGILQRALHLFIGPSTKHISFDQGPPNTPTIDFVNFVLRIMIRGGAAPWTFRVSTWTWWRGAELPPTTDTKTFTRSIEIALASVKRLILLYNGFNGTGVTDSMLDAASRLPELTELDYQSHDYHSTASELPCSEIAFPQLRTIRVRGPTREIRSLLRRVPPRRLRNLEVERGDGDVDEFYPCVADHSQVQSFTLRTSSLDLRALSTRLNMRQLTHLTLVSLFSGPPVTDADIELLANSFPSLVGLEIREAREQEEWSVTISSLRMLASRCPQLQTLALSVNMQKAALIGEPSESSDSMDSKTPTHPSLQDLDLRYSRGLGDDGASIEDVVAFVVRMYPNLQRGRCGHASSAPGDDFCAPSEDDVMNIQAWWKVWKDVEGELGDSFTVAYDPRKHTLTEDYRHMVWDF